MKKMLLLSYFIMGGLFLMGYAQNRIMIKATGSTGNGNATGVFDGGSTLEGYENQIEANAYSDALAGCANIGGHGANACKVSKAPFTFSMGLNFAVISYKYNLLQGKMLSSVEMQLVRSSDDDLVPYYKVKMEDVLVSGVSEGSNNETSPQFNIELRPQKMAWEVIEQGRNGGNPRRFSYGWDFGRNRPWTPTF